MYIVPKCQLPTDVLCEGFLVCLGAGARHTAVNTTDQVAASIYFTFRDPEESSRGDCGVMENFPVTHSV